MRKFLVIAGCLFATSAVRADYSGYTYQRMLTISSANVSNVLGTLSNFPVLVSSNNVAFSTSTGSGGSLNSSGMDLIFSTMSDCSYKLYWDTDTVQNVGVSSFTTWVKLPTLTTATLIAATFYMCYGNSGVTTYQGVSTNTWDSSYKGVFHFGNGVTLSTADATRNQSADRNNSNYTSVGGYFNGASTVATTAHLTVKTAKIIAGLPTWTVSAWINTRAPAAANGRTIYSERGTSGNDILKFDSLDGEGNSHDVFITYRDDAGTLNRCHPTSTIDDGNWHYASASLTGGNFYLYVDNNAVKTCARAGTDTLTDASIQAWVAGDNGDNASQFLGGIDEVRISSGIARSSDWVATEYKNQNSPTTFVTMGSEQTQAAPTGNAFWFGEF